MIYQWWAYFIIWQWNPQRWKNTQIFLQVQKFIQDTGRFTIIWLLYNRVFDIATDLERLFLLFFFFVFLFLLKARCRDQSFLCQRKLWQSFWWNCDGDNGQRNLWSKALTNFDGIELHPIFLQTLMDFDGNQPIRILFWNDEMIFTKQKHTIIKRRERENQ
jgi:hypothetical protein